MKTVLGSIVVLALLLAAGCGDEARTPNATADGAPDGAPHQADRSPVGPADARDPAAPRCMEPPDTLLTGTAAGGLRIGAELDAVRRTCDVVADTTLFLEGIAQPALLVDLAGDTVIAEIVDRQVWRITVSTPGLATARGVRVGDPARRVAALDDAGVAHGEGRDFLLVPSLCGLSFEIGSPRPPEEGWTVGMLRSAPDDVVIARILVTGGCP